MIADKGEIYVQRKKGRVKVVTSVEEQGRILRACHSDATSGHFGSTKTWRRVAERFYWRGMANQVKEMVRFLYLIMNALYRTYSNRISKDLQYSTGLGSDFNITLNFTGEVLSCLPTDE